MVPSDAAGEETGVLSDEIQSTPLTLNRCVAYLCNSIQYSLNNITRKALSILLTICQSGVSA